MPALTEDLLHSCRRLHFVGIGGSGMFPLVQILHAQGYSISGSDNNPGDTIDQERAMGIRVFIGHDAANLGDADAVVYSAAIMADNVELIAAREQGIATIERGVLLGLLSKRYSNCVCVAGTHGKTTTTAMTTQILLAAGLDPSAVIGGKINAINGSGRAGKTDTMTIEACEFVDTFLHLSPDVAVILNIDDDHLDYFKTMDNLIHSFHKFAKSATRAVIYNGDDQNSRKAVEGLDHKRVSFGFSQENDYYPADILWKDGAHCSFTLYHHGERLVDLSLCVPGRHNVLNAVAAAAAALEAGAAPSSLARGLADFTGVHRRFEVLGMINGFTVADDYAHHPTELAATLRAAKELSFGAVWAVFQPFTFSRTAMLLDEFAAALPIADHVVMSAIMGGREHNTYGITTAQLAEKVPDSIWFETFEEIRDYILQHAKPGDLVITLGCGDVYKCARMILGLSIPQ